MRRLLILALLVWCPFQALAGDLFETTLEEAKALRAQGKFGAAVEKLNLAQKEVEKQNLDKLSSFFPQSIEGFSSLEKPRSEGIMGIVSIEQTIKISEEAQAVVTLTGGLGANISGASGEEGPENAMNSFSQVAAALAQLPGSITVQVKGRTASVLIDEDNASLTITLKDNMVFHIEQQDGKVTKEQLVKIAEAFDWDALESYLAR